MMLSMKSMLALASSLSILADTAAQGWTNVAGSGIYQQDPKSDANFRALLGAGCKDTATGKYRACIVRRWCNDCASSHNNIYYKRITPPPPYDFIDLFLNNWSESYNALHVDFELYSSHSDAIAGTNPWQYCDYLGPGVGFPSDCFRSLGEYNNGNWNSLVKNTTVNDWVYSVEGAVLPLETGWKQVAGRQSYQLDPIPDAEFRARIGSINSSCRNYLGESRPCIIRRVCDTCSSDVHKDVYYKRLTPIPGEDQVDFLNLFLNQWSNVPANLLNQDFQLFSTYHDAFAGTNPWEYCDYSGTVGFSGHCSPTEGGGSNQWVSYARGFHHFALYVETTVNYLEEMTTTLDSTNKFDLTFQNPTASSKIFAAIVDIAKCDSENSQDKVNANTFGVVSGGESATIQQFLIDKLVDYEGTHVLDICVRSDVYALSNPTTSIMTKKMTLTLTVNFAAPTSFGLTSFSLTDTTSSTGLEATIKSISTSEFEPSSTSSGVNVQLIGNLGW